MNTEEIQAGNITQQDEKPKEEVILEKKEETVEKKEKIEIARFANKLVGQLKKQGAELKAARALENTGSANPAGEKIVDNKDAENVPVKDENLNEKPKEEVTEEKKEEVLKEKAEEVVEKKTEEVVEEKKEKIEIARFANKLVGQLKKQGAELKAARALNAAGSEKTE